jgi:magnesium-protoporphyrin O-methyltransferase
LSPVAAYTARREWLAEYFDRSAAVAWADLTATGPVSRIRQTVRAGRDRMRETILGWLPADLAAVRILDAGCGTGALSVALAERGASVIGVDIAPAMIQLARERSRGTKSLAFQVGDMLDPSLGQFDVIVAMDSLIHYDLPDAMSTLAALGARSRRRLVVTFAPRTPLLTLMHAAGRLFPRSDRAPAIRPIAERTLRETRALEPWRVVRTRRVQHGFYTSQAYDLARPL